MNSVVLDGSDDDFAVVTTTMKVYMGNSTDEKLLFDSLPLALPMWEAIVVLICLPLIILATIIGNILVILSVLTHAPLKITPNYFIVSLAMADLTVAIFVLPFNLIYNLTGKWLFPPSLCKMWLTSDVLCCTASILNLCAIALDRYYALHDPIAHAQRRTVKYVLRKIFFVWFFSCIICMPPLIGWNDWPDHWTPDTPCKLTEERGYIVYSSMGSFYIPLGLIIFVYWKIFENTRQRLRQRAKASNLTILKRVTRQPNPPQEQHQPEEGQTMAGEKADHQAETMEMKPVSLKVSIEGTKNGAIQTTHVLEPGEDGQNGPRNLSEDADEPIKTTGPSSSSRNNAKKQAQSGAGGNDKVYQFISDKAKISLAKERKAARTMTVIVLTFVVCWLPFFLMYVILPFCSTCYASERIIQIITWLGYINSMLNPLIYTVFNVDFRVAFKRIITGKICKCYS